MSNDNPLDVPRMKPLAALEKATALFAEVLREFVYFRKQVYPDSLKKPEDKYCRRWKEITGIEVEE